MDGYRDRPNVCKPRQGPPGSPTNRQYEDIIFQAHLPEYKIIRQARLERGTMGLTGIQLIMAVIYTYNQGRSRPYSFRGIPGRCAAMQSLVCDRNDIKRHLCDRFGHFKNSAPYPLSISSRMMDGNRRSVKNTEKNPRDSTNETVEADEVT